MDVTELVIRVTEKRFLVYEYVMPNTTGMSNFLDNARELEEVKNRT